MTYPQVIWTLYAFIVGATVGSFLNVCIWRLPRRCLSIFRPSRSICPSCTHVIAWYDNIPILSYIFLGARCRHCKVGISIRYAIVETLTGALFAAFVYLHLFRPEEPEFLLLGVHALLACAILVASFVDWDYMIIPDRITKPGMALAPLLGLLLPAIHRGELLSLPGIFPSVWAGSMYLRGLFTSLFGMVVGAGIIYGMGVVGKVLFRKEAMGFGDVKFMAMIGGVLGWKGVLVSLFLACVSGSVVGLVRKAVTGDSYIPFGPFLGLGAVAMMVFGGEILLRVNDRFGELIQRFSDRMGSGTTLAVMLTASILALVALVWRSRRRPTPGGGAPAGPVE